MFFRVSRGLFHAFQLLSNRENVECALTRLIIIIINRHDLVKEINANHRNSHVLLDGMVEKIKENKTGMLGEWENKESGD